MPHLNWREEAGIMQEIDARADQPRATLTLTLGATRLHALANELEAAFAASAELRMDLPREWIVFWKLRDGESRLLIAHPRADEWVATAALTAEHGQALIQGLRGTVPELKVGALHGVASVSNLELVLKR